jgi:hypothetical protein
LAESSGGQLRLLALALIATIIVSVSGLQPVSGLTIPSLDISSPGFVNPDGETTNRAAPGQQMIVTLSVRNNIYLDEEKQMVIIFEARDQQGVTNYLAWQSTKVAHNDTYTAGISWSIPYSATAGTTFSARTFAITELGDSAQSLSEVRESNLLVI